MGIVPFQYGCNAITIGFQSHGTLVVLYNMVVVPFKYACVPLQHASSATTIYDPLEVMSG